MKILRNFLKVIVVFLTAFSLFCTLYEYGNYKKDYNSIVFAYEQGEYLNNFTFEEICINDIRTYELFINTFQSILYLNLIIVLLVGILWFTSSSHHRKLSE